MNIDRHNRKLDGDSLNNFTIAHYLSNNNNNSNSTRDIMNNVINIKTDGSHEFDAHSSPVIAPSEQNHNRKYSETDNFSRFFLSHPTESGTHRVNYKDVQKSQA